MLSINAARGLSRIVGDTQRWAPGGLFTGGGTPENRSRELFTGVGDRWGEIDRLGDVLAYRIHLNLGRFAVRPRP